MTRLSLDCSLRLCLVIAALHVCHWRLTSTRHQIRPAALHYSGAVHSVANLIVRMDVWEKFHRVARTAPAFIASGRLQNQQGVIPVLVSRLENLNDAIGGLRSASRNFH